MNNTEINLAELPLLKIENLSVSFGAKNAPQVLQDFNLDIFEGDKIAVIGETGSGKSVMLLAVLKLLPKNAAVQGSAFFKNRNLLNLDRRTLNTIRGKEISYIPQGSGNSLNPLLKVGYQVGEPLIIHYGYSKKNAEAEAVNLLHKFNLGNEEERAVQYPHTYSGGMKQRAMIAMGISAGAHLIFADEPTKGLDSRRLKMVEQAFKLLKEETYVCVTHDLNFAKNISKKLCVMHSSYSVEIGLTEEVFAKPYHPYTEDIIRAMPENGLQYKAKSMYRPVYETGCRYAPNCEYAFEKCKQTPPMIDIEKNRKVRCWKYA